MRPTDHIQILYPPAGRTLGWLQEEEEVGRHYIGPP